jgi:hypothetical protein
MVIAITALVQVNFTLVTDNFRQHASGTGSRDGNEHCGRVRRLAKD